MIRIRANQVGNTAGLFVAADPNIGTFIVEGSSSIPTLSEWGLILLIGFLLLLGVARLQQRQTH